MFAFSDKNEFQGRGEEISSHFNIFPHHLAPFTLDSVSGEAAYRALATLMRHRTAEEFPSAPGTGVAPAIYARRPQHLGPAMLNRGGTVRRTTLFSPLRYPALWGSSWARGQTTEPTSELHLLSCSLKQTAAP